MAAPELVSTTPVDNSYLKQVSSISVTLFDQKGSIDDASITSSFSVTDSGSQSVAGSLSEANDTFTFTPSTLPLPDSTYPVSFTAADTYGNTADHVFSFTVDSQPPAKPVITGGTVASGIIQPRPFQNESSTFYITLEGSREDNTSIWINGEQRVSLGSGDWSVGGVLQLGENALEVWAEDMAGNRSASEWVDINVQTKNAVVFEINEAGRIKKIRNFQ